MQKKPAFAFLSWAVLGAAAAAMAAPPPLASRDAAHELVSTMAAEHLDAIAAKDPEVPGGYVAALLFPGSQLLVVAAQYPSPPYLDQALQNRAYRDVYTALQQSAAADTKLFVQDLGADGLHAADNQPVDVVYEKVVNQTVFDGDPSHKTRDYDARLAAADARYTRLLRLLRDAARQE